MRFVTCKSHNNRRKPKGLDLSKVDCSEHKGTMLDGAWCKKCQDWRCQYCGKPDHNMGVQPNIRAA